MKLRIFVIVFLFGFMDCFGQDKDSLILLLKNHPQQDSIRCNLLEKYVELDEDQKTWPKYNTELKTLLLKIINNKTLQQTNEEWYVKKLIVCLEYEAQDLIIQYSSFDKAIEIQFLMLKYATEIKNKRLIALSYNEIANSFIKQKFYEKSLIYFLKNESLLKLTNDFKLLSTTYNGIGQTYAYLKDFDKALFYFNKALPLRKIYYPKALSVTYSNIGLIYIEKKQFETAMQYFTKAIELNRKNKFEELVCYNLINVSKINSIQKKYLVAIKNLEEGLFFAKKINNIALIETSSRMLSILYEKQGYTLKSYEMFKLATKFKDSIYNDNNKSDILQTEFKYETEKKEAQITALAKDKKIATLESQRQKNIALVLGIAIISLLITSYFLFNRFKIKKQNELLKTQLVEAEKTIEAEKKATESELKALKSQMNPHFIFNALSSIQDQFMYGDKVIANEQMGNFTYLTRQILNVSGKKQILLATEIDILSKYLELEKMRFKTGFEYAITTSQNIDEDYHEIPPMIIQPFVENAMKHGLLHKIGEKKLTVHFDLSSNEDFLICTITDNGIGRKASAAIKEKSAIKHESFSTQSIAQRLDILKKDGVTDQLVVYNDVLDQDNLVIGTSVVVKIPIGE